MVLGSILTIVVHYIDLRRQNQLLPHAVPEQVAVRRNGTRQRSHRQSRVFHSFRLRHQLEQSDRTVSQRVFAFFLLTLLQFDVFVRRHMMRYELCIIIIIIITWCCARLVSKQDSE